AIIFGFDLLQIINQVFFWQVGRSFYTESSDLKSIFSAYFKVPETFYFEILEIMFPVMFWMVLSGILGIIILTIIKSLDRKPGFKNIHLDSIQIKLGKVRVPYNIFNLCFVFFISILIISMGQMYNQQRYIYFLMPLFVLIFAYMVYLVSILLARLTVIMAGKVRKSGIDKRVLNSVFILIFIIIAFFTISGIDLEYAWAISDIKHSDSLDTRYSISSSMTFHWDPATAGNYVYQNSDEDDIIITTNLYNSYPYTGRLDYWLWTGNLVSWAPYHQEGNQIIDDTHGIRVLRSAVDLIDIFEDEADTDIWITTSPSLYISGHINPDIRELLEKYPGNQILTARDGVSGLYHFPAGEARPVLSDLIPPTVENTISVLDGVADIYFTNKDNNRYLVYGMDNIEEGIGSWALDGMSLLYFELEENTSYRLTITARPLINPARSQSMELLLDDNSIGTIEFPGEDIFGEYHIDFDTESINTGISVLKIKYAY
ncbi:MAG: hypothetical protein KAI62_00385, partial [Actinomycetia bacterium]|nr:hypothetical protein [Actinomycetes bacterium]